jgi:hypothetical protein
MKGLSMNKFPVVFIMGVLAVLVTFEQAHAG